MLVGCLEGNLDSPTPDEAVAGDSFLVRGWLFSREAPIRTLTLKRRGGMPRAIPMGMPRAELAGRFPDQVLASSSGFEAKIPVGRGHRGEVALELWAELDDGRELCAFERRIVIERASGRLWRASELSALVRGAAEKGARAFKEGRLPLSPRKWLRDLRLHYEESASVPRAAAPPSRNAPAADLKAQHARRCAVELRELFDSGARLRFAEPSEPAVSIVLVLFNRAELTYRCLRSLLSVTLPFELVIADNASSDATTPLLDRLDGARILRHGENLGFTRAVNAAARVARGRHLLLLNNDAELLPGAVESAVRTLESAPDIGAVAGKLILHDGSLQEAGSIIWRDGSCAGYGRGDSPSAPEYGFARDIDYGSGAFLLTPRALFSSLGGFDEAFAPAYYEDTDYCARLWQQSKRVVYDPNAAAVHVEFASSASPERALALQAERRARFAAKHADWLRGQPPPGSPPLFARARRSAGLRVLLLDDRVPRAHHGSGHPRARSLLDALVAAGHFVTVYPTLFAHEDQARADLPPTVEVMFDGGTARLAAFLTERRGYYDRVIVSRPHNLRLLRGAWPDGVRVLYDAEAIFALRDALQRRLRGERLSQAALSKLIDDELALTRGVDAVLAVSDAESERFRASGMARVYTLGHTLTPSPTPRPFTERAGLLFVGAFYDDQSPNTDSVVWFVEEIWPRIREALDGDPWLTIAGTRPTRRVVALAGERVEVLGRVEELAPLYDRARLFIAPTRFATGVPYKVHHAAAHGLPAVTTSLLASQLGWRDGEALLTGDTPESFAAACCRLYRDAELWRRVRDSALARVEAECSQRQFRATLDEALREA